MKLSTRNMVRLISSLAFLCFFFLCPQNSASASADFDFYYLVLEWPGSYCKGSNVSSCCKPDNPFSLDADFLVKGFYTYNSSGAPVSQCHPTKFFIHTLVNLIGELFMHWPSIECPSNDGVPNWKEAWTNYGVCTGLKTREYFQKALELRAKIDLLSVLTSKGIVPSDEFSYLDDYVKNAIKSGIGADVGIRCNVNKESGGEQIHEIYVCVDKTATEIVECPVLLESNCGPSLFLPTFSRGLLIDTTSCDSANVLKLSE